MAARSAGTGDRIVLPGDVRRRARRGCGVGPAGGPARGPSLALSVMQRHQPRRAISGASLYRIGGFARPHRPDQPAPVVHHPGRGRHPGDRGRAERRARPATQSRRARLLSFGQVLSAVRTADALSTSPVASTKASGSLSAGLRLRSWAARLAIWALTGSIRIAKAAMNCPTIVTAAAPRRYGPTSTSAYTLAGRKRLSI